jgi:hypothetical protein
LLLLYQFHTYTDIGNQQGARMARRVNYGYEKNQKEMKRKKKQAAKLEKKRLNKEANKAGVVPTDEQAPAPTDADSVPVTEEKP